MAGLSHWVSKVICILGKHSPIIHSAIWASVFLYISIWPGNAFASGRPPNWVTLNFGLDASNAKVAVQPVSGHFGHSGNCHSRSCSSSGRKLRFYRCNTPKCSGIKVSQPGPSTIEP